MSDDLRLPAALVEKLNALRARHAEVEQQLTDSAVLADAQKLVPLTREKGRLDPLASAWQAYQDLRQEAADLREMAAGDDAEMAELAASEVADAEAKLDAAAEALRDHFLDAEEAPVGRFFLELRAGTGGDEAALFVGDLLNMYKAFAEAKRFKLAVEDFSESERGGFKEVIAAVSGEGAWQALRFEAGGHRVQRVPETETQGRIHTSAATVAVLPELEDVEIEIDPKDIEEGGCKAGGPGGQNVNKVETGWRISHKPSGLQFKITEQKSQAQNKIRAWALLKSALYEQERSKQQAEQSGLRKSMMGSGDRSQRVRTYNFPQNRCTDHRLGGDDSDVKNFNLDKIVAGDLTPLVEALNEVDKQQRLAAL
jgi:peptide chain release factor 1